MNFDAISLIIYFLVTGFLFVLPYVVFPTLPFGVRIPLACMHDPAIIAERRRYALRLGILAGGVFLADIALWSLTGWQNLPQLSIFVLAVGGWGVYYLSHRSLAQVKISQHWFADTRQAIAASAVHRSKLPSRLFWIFLALPCAVLILTIAIGSWRYSSLPAMLHFVFPQNLGNRTLVTTPVNASLPVIFQGISILIFGGLAWLRNFGSQSIDVEDPVDSIRYNQINIQIIQVLLLLLALGFNSAFLVNGLMGWGLLQVSSSLTSVIILAPLAGWLIVAPILLLGLRRNSHIPVQSGNHVNRDDDRFWKLGVIYFNRNDPALLVPKRFGIGRTLNLGHPVAWVILPGIAVIILARVLKRF
jgi:uncharacterized membrane protein